VSLAERPLACLAEIRPSALVVDDDPATGDQFARELHAAGIDAIVVHNGKHALEVLRYETVHVVILDRHMPGLDGLEVIERLRAEPSTVHLPVILVTSDTDLTDRVYGLEHGADDYITKPVELDELVARARAQLRRRSPDDGIREFVESANDAFVSWDAFGTITEWTAQAESLFGWSRREALGESFGKMVLAPRHRIVHALRMERFLRDGERPLLGKWFELTGLHRDQREIPIEMTVWIVSHEEHHTFNAFVRDLAKRSEIEDALRDRARLQTIVNGVNDVILLTDLLGVIEYTSAAARSVLGYEPDELYGHMLDEFVHAEDQGAFTRSFDRAIETGSEIVKAQRIRARDDRYVWMETTTAVVRDSVSGEVTGLEIVSRDITSHRLADAARKRATGDLTRMIKDLRAAVGREHETVEELRALTRNKSELVATVSHELRTPLTSITAYAELLADPSVGPLSDRQRSMLEVVDRNTNRLLSMIENLLTIGGIEAGAFDVELRPLELLPIVRTAAEATLAGARSQDISLTFDLAADTGLVLGDAPQLDRVLLNLLSNALKFNVEGGSVAVSSRRLDSAVEVIVADTGIGIPPDEQNKLFAPFFRSTIAAERSVPGSGLGLAIVKNIIDRHGGDIAIQSNPGDGTTVRFTLPAAAPGAGPRSEVISKRMED
jgi:PAS domain S-box-containing protein